MKTLAVSLLALGAMSSVALAEPMKLTSTQLDQLTAAGFRSNFNATKQVAVAIAAANGGCNVAVCVGGANGNAAAVAIASNSNTTRQHN